MLHNAHNRPGRRDARQRPGARGQAYQWTTGHVEDSVNDRSIKMRTKQLGLGDSHAFENQPSLGHERPRHAMDRQDKEIDIQSAVRKLDATLRNTVQACTTFITSFDEEISSIKHYTDPRLQDTIWVKKHAYHEKSTRSTEGNEAGESFRKVQKQLTTAYGDIIAALSRARHRQPMRAENMTNDPRLCKKICDSKDILKVFNDGSLHRSSFENFLTEARIIEAIIHSTSYLAGEEGDSSKEQNEQSSVEGWSTSD